MNRHPLRALFLTLAVVCAAALITWTAITPGFTRALAVAPPYFTPEKDAWVNEEKPTSNYGTSSELHVGRVESLRSYYNRASLVYFDLSTIPPGSTITLATLELYQSQAGLVNF